MINCNNLPVAIVSGGVVKLYDVTLKGKQIPLFGSITQQLNQAYQSYERAYVNYFRDLGIPMQYNPGDRTKDIERLAREGALLRTIKMQKGLGRLIEAGCGLGISSLAYGLLGNNRDEAIAIDEASNITKAGKKCASSLGARSVTYLTQSFENFLPQIRPNDLVYAVGLEDNLHDLLLNHLGQEIKHLVLTDKHNQKYDSLKDQIAAEKNYIRTTIPLVSKKIEKNYPKSFRDL